MLKGLKKCIEHIGAGAVYRKEVALTRKSEVLMRNYVNAMMMSMAAAGLMLTLNSCEQAAERREEHKEVKVEKTEKKDMNSAADQAPK
jgi:hypothetical protein